MRQEIELDFDSICSVDLSPNTVLPSIPRHSSITKRNKSERHKHKPFVLNVKGDFTEIRFDHRQGSCKSNSPRPPVELEGNELLKRGSVYQSSEDVGKIEDMNIRGERRKIEISHDYDTSLSFGIVDSLCSLDEESPQKRSPVFSLNTKMNQPLTDQPYVGPHLSDGFIEIYLDSDNDKLVQEDSSIHLENVGRVGSLKNSEELLKRDRFHTFQKSFSAKVEMPQKQFPLESDPSSRQSKTVRFSPFRKMLDPFVKSKSVRSPFSYGVETGGDKTVGKVGLRRNKTFIKSLLQDFSNTAKDLDSDSSFVKNDNHHSVVASSPVHLHGSLKLEKKNGMSFFDFSQSFPEDVYVAKMWKTCNPFKWVYTFHTLDGQKKRNASGLGLNASCKNSMVGQMQVSCYLSSELRDSGFENSMVTEFVLYDIAHAKQSSASQENCNSIREAVKPPKSSNSGLAGEAFSTHDGTSLDKPKFQQRYAFDNRICDIVDTYPWESADLHPDHESAAIIMQIPFSKRESLKHTRSDKTGSKMNPILQNLSMVEPRENDPPAHPTQEILKVVIPIGNHGLPVVESHSPSTLLDRWRLGGGCDCGGWDMGCPLLILSTQCSENQTFKEKQDFELFLQGVKDKTPALAMNVVKDGHYTIDFHAQLSTLQAFSICVAILHATEACTAIQVEETKQLPHCNSLKVLLEEEVKLLFDAVTLEEENKETRILKEKPQSYMLNPPFSPIARV